MMKCFLSRVSLASSPSSFKTARSIRRSPAFHYPYPISSNSSIKSSNIDRAISLQHHLFSSLPSSDEFHLSSQKQQQQQQHYFDPSLPIEESWTPPSIWYTSQQTYQTEQEQIFSKQWMATTVLLSTEPGSYQTGTFQQKPYLLTVNEDNELQAFWNICTHAASCLVGPWTEAGRTKQACPKLSTDMVGKETSGNLLQSQDEKDGDEHNNNNNNNQHHETTAATTTRIRKKRPVFQCPYHGWQFNLNGSLVKATSLKGIKNFSPKEHGLRRIAVQHFGPLVFLNFHHGDDSNDGYAGDTQDDTQDDTNNSHTSPFLHTKQLLESRLQDAGFVGDFSDLTLIHTASYPVQCNWKVFLDNYGDGCYHCEYAHPDLASTLDQSRYQTDLVSPELSIQHAPPESKNGGGGVARFGGTSRSAVYACWYPNVMLNRYGPWLDLDLVEPVDANSCVVHKWWFLEKECAPAGDDGGGGEDSFIRESLEGSQQVHEEDAFLCENVQRGLMAVGGGSAGGFRGRYVPSRQIAAHHFHRRLAADLMKQQ